VAIGDSSHLREQTREVIHQFISFIFAPLFFASIGLKVNFVTHFDGLLILTVCLIACVGKVLGGTLGARYSGMNPREAWAVGFAMNARGAMEIILGLVALQYGVIHERLFVALVIMALFTSMLSGPMMQRILGRRKSRQITDYLTARAFLNPLHAHSRQEAITALAQSIRPIPDLSADTIIAAVLEREYLMPTGLGHGVAVPHARIDGLPVPVVAVGLSRGGIDFDAVDGKPAQIIFLLLTPLDDDGAQLEILADITGIFKDADVPERALEVNSYTEFLALLKSESTG
jgi:mannitol/fructose-specific phosphotransferase system IIA component (Ntr-type)